MKNWVFQVRTYRTRSFGLATVLLVGLPCVLAGSVGLGLNLEPVFTSDEAMSGPERAVELWRSVAWGALLLAGLFLVMYRRTVKLHGRLMQMRVGWGRPTLYWGEPLFLHSAGRVSLRAPEGGRGVYRVLVEMEDGERVPVTEFPDERAARASYEEIKEFLQGKLYERPSRATPAGAVDAAQAEPVRRAG